ncbi:putative signal peptide protein [Puccinia sorghi]|uniref:Putative signal peptide protein n=1 Tax=Puccinia sorghi TaxID=27349 RepID=A0A0L6VS73_9BASI|nr:putative signal peptide protein [Puccinia sorghi]
MIWSLLYLSLSLFHTVFSSSLSIDTLHFPSHFCSQTCFILVSFFFFFGGVMWYVYFLFCFFGGCWVGFEQFMHVVSWRHSWKMWWLLHVLITSRQMYKVIEMYYVCMAGGRSSQGMGSGQRGRKVLMKDYHGPESPQGNHQSSIILCRCCFIIKTSSLLSRQIHQFSSPYPYSSGAHEGPCFQVSNPHCNMVALMLVHPKKMRWRNVDSTSIMYVSTVCHLTQDSHQRGSLQRGNKTHILKYISFFSLIICNLRGSGAKADMVFHGLVAERYFKETESMHTAEKIKILLGCQKFVCDLTAAVATVTVDQIPAIFSVQQNCNLIAAECRLCYR